MINKKMLTAFIVLLSLFLLASCGSGGKKETSASAFDYVINGTGNNSEVEIIELKNNSLKNIVIPTSIEGHLVTKISSNAFKDATKLKEGKQLYD